MSWETDNELDDLDPRSLREDIELIRFKLEHYDEIARSPRLNEHLWFGFTRWRWMQASYVFVCVMMILAVWLAVENSNNIEEEERERAVQRCEVVRDARVAVRNLVFELIDLPQPTPEQSIRIEHVRQIVDEHLPVVDCTNQGIPEPER